MCAKTIKSTFYPDSPSSPDFPLLEEEVLTYWKTNKVFEASVAQRPPKQGGESNEYVFYDGPPFANGLPHHGHLLTGFVKDLFARYHTMKGERVERRFGWDCHGLPAEMGAEKELNISGRKNIAEFGIDKFNDHCRRSVMQYRDQWEWYVNRQARWVDFEHDYKTMELPYMESVLWAFKELYKKGYIYEGFKVMPYSWAAETVLSSSEIRLDDATREKEDKAVTVAFKLKERPEGAPEADNYYVLAWTTTPWTLPSNLALAVSGEMEYAAIMTNDGECYICSESGSLNATVPLHKAGLLAAEIYEGEGVTNDRVTTKEIEIRPHHSIIRGVSLTGLSYEPLFPYFAGTKNAFRILDGSDFIEEGSGTGIVHMAPGFGEDDQRVCAENGIEVVVPVDGEGRYTDAIYDLPAIRIRHPERVAPKADDEGSQEIPPASGDAVRNDEWVLETARCRLRPVTADDIALIESINNHPEVVKTTYNGHQSPEQLQDYLDDLLQTQAKYGVSQWLVFDKASGELVGRAGLNYRNYPDMEYHWEISRALLPDYWNKGLGHELAEAWIHVAFETLDIDALYVGSMSNNPKARYTQEKLGFRYDRRMQANVYNKEAEQGYLYQMTRAEYERRYPSLSLRGLNVIKETQGKRDDEPYSEQQLEKYGLANLRIIDWLKQRGRLIKQDNYLHNYPHCWRTDQPIIYMAMSSWFVDVPQFRERMVELNEQINWMPDHVKHGRFGKWIENAREWSISRSRFWGCPIPVWRSDNPDNDELYVFGSIAELEEFFGPHMKESPPLNLPPQGGEATAQAGAVGGEFRITDLHRPYIDQLTAPDPTNPAYTIRRVEDVFDCWFESGSMPYAQVHYPFENKEWFETHFPADFIVEYEAQTRGWFYNMMVLSVALFDRVPFKNCICHGVVLDDSGRKLSKKLQNYMDPKLLFEQYGSDALRWFMMSSAIMRGSELLLDAEGKFIHDAIRLYLKPIWNAYHFFTLYANADGVRAESLFRHSERSAASEESQSDPSSSAFADAAAGLARDDRLNLMDRYILAKCRAMVEDVQAALDAYDTPKATHAITEFVEVLNNWYIRRNKERFWSAVDEAADPASLMLRRTSKQAAYDTLYTVLHILCRAAAPLLPMVSEAIFLGLHNRHPERGAATEGSHEISPASNEAVRNDDETAMSPRSDRPNSSLASASENLSEIISVHLVDWPDVSTIDKDERLVADMDRVRDACNTLLSIRSEAKIRIRQPLASSTLYGPGATALAPFADLIADEVNLKSVDFSDDLQAAAEQKLTIHFPIAGKRLGSKMKAVAAAAKAGDWQIHDGKMMVGGEPLQEGEYTMQLIPKDGVKGAQALSSNDALVILDLEITPELAAEGTARDLVRLIQQARKEADLNVTDRIALRIEASESVQTAAQAHRDYIAEQTLASALVLEPAAGSKFVQQAELNGEPVTIGFSLAQKDAA